MKPLLIVPCGIETRKNRWLATGMSPLLIVPCGIETTYKALTDIVCSESFNRTLWN